MNQKRNRGFSLIELLIVMAIILVVSALALPNIMQAIQAYKMRNILGGFANLSRDVRARAIRDNREYKVFWYWDPSNRLGFFGDYNNNFAYDVGEPLYLLPNGAWIDFGGISPSIASMNLTYNQNWNLPAFNSRGAPCIWWMAPCATVNGGPVGFQMAFYDMGVWWGQSTMWGAVTVHPGGRVKTWLWSGSTWQGQ